MRYAVLSLTSGVKLHRDAAMYAASAVACVGWNVRLATAWEASEARTATTTASARITPTRATAAPFSRPERLAARGCGTVPRRRYHRPPGQCADTNALPRSACRRHPRPRVGHRQLQPGAGRAQHAAARARAGE